MKHRSQYWTACIALFTFLVLGLGSLNGLVICFEPDGRISLESGIAGVCSDSLAMAQDQQVSAEELSIDAAHCKRCVDIPITLESTQPHGSDIQTFSNPVSIPMVAMAPSQVVGYLSTLTESRMPQPPPPLKPSIHRFLNTVILLI